MSLIKKIGFGVAGLVAVSVLFVAGVLGANKIQTLQDTKVLKQFVQAESKLKPLHGRAFTTEQVSCQPPGSLGDHCPSLVYAVSDDECADLMTTYRISKEWCGGDAHVTYQGRAVVVRFGQAYSRPDGGLYVQVIMNEKNLL